MVFKMCLNFDDENPALTRKVQELRIKILEHEKINEMLKDSNNVNRQRLEHHKAEIKVLKDALQAKATTIKELSERVETLTEINQLFTTIRSDIDKQQQQSNTKNNNCNKKPIHNGNKIADNHGKNKKLIKESSTLNASTNDKSKNNNRKEYTNVANCSNEDSETSREKEENLNAMRRNTVVIKNFKSSDLSQDNALANVIGLAEQMGLTLAPTNIKHITVVSEDRNSLTYYVYFLTRQIKDQFLKKIDVLKDLPDTKFLTIW